MQHLHSLDSPLLPRPILGFRFRSSSPFMAISLPVLPRGFRCRRKDQSSGNEVKAKVKEKGNVWSIDNDLAEDKEWRRGRKADRRTGKGKPGKGRPKGKEKGKEKGKGKESRVLVSGAMLMEVETVLQAQEPVIKPNWDTFASSVSGIWKGVGSVFSPLTSEMEPIGIGKKDEPLYDCYTLSHIEKKKEQSLGQFSQIYRRMAWIPFNPFGEAKHLTHTSAKNKKDDHLLSKKEKDLLKDLPRYESFDFQKSEEVDEDFLNMEPGTVFFEDGSYSRGPAEISVGEHDKSTYMCHPTFKFEQCLVKGCHKRLRILHTIEFADGGANIQIIRVSMYEETWDSPTNIDCVSETPFDLKPFSQRMRTKPTELVGSWKVFEVSCTPTYTEEMAAKNGGPPYVYLCMETMKKRSLPENQVSFGEEEAFDTEDWAILWLPGGVTGYVDVKDDGVLCIGVGWYSDEGINLVMERDYGTDGKLKEVRWKSEVKRRWEDPLQLQD